MKIITRHNWYVLHPAQWMTILLEPFREMWNYNINLSRDSGRNRVDEGVHTQARRQRGCVW